MPSLSGEDWRRLARGLLRGPESVGLRNAAVDRRLIEQEFGVRYHPGHIGRIKEQTPVVKITFNWKVLSVIAGMKVRNCYF